MCITVYDEFSFSEDFGSPTMTIQKDFTVIRSGDLVQDGECNAVNFHLYTAKTLYKDGGFYFSP